MFGHWNIYNLTHRDYCDIRLQHWRHHFAIRGCYFVSLVKGFLRGSIRAAYNATRSQRPLRRHRHESWGNGREGYTKAPSQLRFIFRLSRARISLKRELLAGPLNSARTLLAPAKDISLGTTTAAESSF